MPSLAQTDRRIPLEAGFNLRDFGGYATADGRKVKRGQLFRSGTMSLLTEADGERLRAFGIRTICDFRRQDERLAEPTQWHESASISYWSRDYEGQSGLLWAMIRDPDTTAQRVRDAMVQLYRDIPVDHAPAYREMFTRVARGELPILINCSAGKDRTGVGAALLLSVLGVSRETVEEDYLATNLHADWDMLFAGHGTAAARFSKYKPEVIAPLKAAHSDYLNMFFATLDADHGGVEGYLASIGVDAGSLAAIRALLLEP